MSVEMVPCAVVGWCTGHMADGWESQAPVLHSSPDEYLFEDDEEEYGPDANWIRVSRTLDAMAGKERLYVEADMSAELEYAQLPIMANILESAAARLREIAVEASGRL